jgi:SAM-dependent methyltransferase
VRSLSEFADVDALGAAAAVDYLDAAAEDLAALKAGLRGLLAARPGDRILDAGCGLGDDVRALSALVEPGGEVVGLDASAVMIDEARRRTSQAHVRFVRGDAAAMPFAANAFDAVRVERMLQHVSEPATAIAELARVLRPGGRIVIAEPDWPDLRVLGCPEGLAADIATRLRARIRQPELARSLTDLLRDGGLCEVCEHRLPLVIHDPEMARRIVARSGIGGHALREWRTRTPELPQRRLAFVTLPVVAVTARRQPGPRTTY